MTQKHEVRRGRKCFDLRDPPQLARDAFAFACDEAQAIGKPALVRQDALRDELRERADVVWKPGGVVHRGDPPIRDERAQPQARGRARLGERAGHDEIRSVGDARHERVTRELRVGLVDHHQHPRRFSRGEDRGIVDEVAGRIVRR